MTETGVTEERAYLVNLTHAVVHFQDAERKEDFDLQPFGDPDGEDRRLASKSVRTSAGVRNAIKKNWVALLPESKLQELNEQWEVVRPDSKMDTEVQRTLVNVGCVGVTILGTRCTRTVAVTEDTLESTPPLCGSCREHLDVAKYHYQDGAWVHEDFPNPVKVDFRKPEIEIVPLPTGEEDFWDPEG